MTESPVHVRARARVGDERPGGAAPATLTARRRPGYLGPVHVIQLLLIEAAVIAVLAVAGHGVLALGVAGVLGVVLLVVTLSRREGRWWIERRLMTRQYRRRRRARPVAHPTDPRLTALRWLAPSLSVEQIQARDGAQIGVARDDAGWFAVAAVGARSAMSDQPHPGLPLHLLVRALVEVEQPGAVLQVVTHTVPAPSLEVDAGKPAGHSYRELLQRFGPVPIPVDRVSWVAVRLDARALAESGVDGAVETDQAPAAVATLARRVAKALRQVGMPYQVLDASGLLDALTRSCDLVYPVQAGPAPDPREDWSAWHSGRLAHRSFWVADWPGVAQSGALLDWLSTAPSAQSSVAMILAPDGDPGDTVDLRCVVRVAAPPKELAGVVQAVEKGARLAGARLFPLDGEQGPAAYASAPTGGGAR
jgi:type VII secretion protein EccE